AGDGRVVGAPHRAGRPAALAPRVHHHRGRRRLGRRRPHRGRAVILHAPPSRERCNVTKTTKTTKKNAAADEPTNEKVKLSPKEIAEAVRAPKDAAPSLGPKPPADREDLEPSGPEVTSVRVLVRMNELTVIPRRVFEHRSEEHTSELQSRENLVCRLLLEKKNI